MEQIILVIHLVTALAIIGLILLQQGKGADMGASFGAGASQTLFGSDGSANMLTRATAWLVVVFFSTSFGLAILDTQRSAGVDELDLVVPPAQQSELPAEQRAPGDEELPVVEEQPPVATDPGGGDDLPRTD